jgi:glucokinase
MKRPGNSIAIGVDLGGHNLRGALVDSGGRVLTAAEMPTAEGRAVADVVRQIADMCRRLSADPSASGSRLVGAGIGVPGFTDHEKGFLYFSPNFPSWKDLQLGDILRKEIPLPVVTENDANCATLGEWWVGAARGSRVAVCLTLGTGVGGGVVVDGRLLRGTHGAAGELGHAVVEPEGPVCGCGGQGCLETFVGGTHLKKKTGKSVQELHEAALAGDASARETFREVGRYLGIALSSFGQVFDPDVFVLGGRISRAFPLFEAGMKSEMARRLRNHPSRWAVVEPATCGDQAGLLGAAFLALETCGESAA